MLTCNTAIVSRTSSRPLRLALRCRYNNDGSNVAPQVARTFRWNKSEEQRLHSMSKVWFKERSRKDLKESLAGKDDLKSAIHRIRGCRDWKQLRDALGAAHDTLPESQHTACLLPAATRLSRIVHWVPPASYQEETDLLAFLQSFTHSIPPHLPTLSPQDTATLLHHLALTGRPLHLRWLTTALDTLFNTLPTAPAPTTLHALTAATAFNHPLTPNQLHCCSTALLVHLPTLTASETTTVLAALSTYPLTPPTLHPLCTRIFQLIDSLSLYHLSDLVNGLVNVQSNSPEPPGPAAASQISTQLIITLSDPQRLAPPKKTSLRRGETRPKPRTPQENRPEYAIAFSWVVLGLLRLGWRPDVFSLKVLLLEAARLCRCCCCGGVAAGQSAYVLRRRMLLAPDWPLLLPGGAVSGDVVVGAGASRGGNVAGDGRGAVNGNGGACVADELTGESVQGMRPTAAPLGSLGDQALAAVADAVDACLFGQDTGNEHQQRSQVAGRGVDAQAGDATRVQPVDAAVQAVHMAVQPVDGAVQAVDLGAQRAGAAAMHLEVDLQALLDELRALLGGLEQGLEGMDASSCCAASVGRVVRRLGAVL